MKRLKWASIILVILFVSGFTAFFLPKPPLLSEISFSKAVYDEKGHLLRLTLSQDDKYRLFVPLAEISPTVIATTLLQEDQYFHWHIGINPIALLKAAWQTYGAQSRRIGASTITMQVARLYFHLDSKTASGKILQILRALQLEFYYSKNAILEAYLNLAPYGHNIEGVGAAALIYDGKPVHQLSLPEALTLSVIPQNPTERIPQQKKLKAMRDKLFLRWVKQHPEDQDHASLMALPIQMQKITDLPYFAPHFVGSVLQHSNPQDHAIITTLNLRLQLLLEKVIARYLAHTKNLGITNAAVLLIDTRTMGIKAAIGSADFFNPTIQGQINGTEIKRSPGSTLKPFIYGLALDQGLIHPLTMLKDVPHRFGHYNPENFDADFIGPVSAKDALVLSRNIPAIALAEQLTHPTLYQLLTTTGITHLKSAHYYGLGLALGGAELTLQELAGLYAMLANGGVWHPLQYRTQQSTTVSRRLLSREASFLVLEMLAATPLSAAPPVIAAKTGTSSGYRDAWTVGVVGPYVLAVWLGNFNNAGNPALVGKTLAAPLFFDLATALKQQIGSLPTVLPLPADLHLRQVAVCKASGLLPTRYCHDTELTWFIPGKSPIKTDTIHREIAIDQTTGLRTCHFNQQTRFAIYEFWPSDILRIFQQAGIKRRTPPPYDASCTLTTLRQHGIAPEITSPETHIQYILHGDFATTLPLTAVADADVVTLFWFMNETYLGKSLRDQPFLWKVKPGRFVIRVVDDYGRSDARDVIVQNG